MTVSSATAIVIFIVFRGKSISKYLQVCGADTCCSTLKLLFQATL